MHASQNSAFTAGASWRCTIPQCHMKFLRCSSSRTHKFLSNLPQKPIWPHHHQAWPNRTAIWNRVPNDVPEEHGRNWMDGERISFSINPWTSQQNPQPWKSPPPSANRDRPCSLWQSCYVVLLWPQRPGEKHIAIDGTGYGIPVPMDASWEMKHLRMWKDHWIASIFT